MAMFDLAALMRDVPGMGTGRQEITYLPLDLIDPDANNFYSLDGIDELAGSIEMLGLQQPLLVRPAPGGHYTVISGHRRRAALLLLADGETNPYPDGVPCIIDATEASDALQELKLIMANSDTRKMSSADQSKQAERIEDLLRQLEDEGYEFPGRLRDWVAELSGMSRSKLGRLKVIRDKLERSIFKGYYEKGLLKETSAYSLAQLPEEQQRQIVDWYVVRRNNGKRDLAYLYDHTIQEYAQDLDRLAALHCPGKQGGGKCENCAGIMDHLWSGSYRAYGGACAKKGCCAGCDELSSCKYVCSKMQERAKALKAEAKAERAAEKVRREENEREPREFVRNVWLRFGNALSRADLEEADVQDIRRIWNVPGDEVIRLEAGESTKVAVNTPMPFGNTVYLEDAKKLIALADRLDCTVDYLLCRTDEPKPAPSTTPLWSEGEPTEEGRYLCAVDLGTTGPLHEQRCEWRGGEWLAYGNPIKDMFKVKYWHRLPDAMPF